MSDRRTTIRISDHESPEYTVQVGIPQGSPISPILYLFYNADLLEICRDDQLPTSPTGFVDDVNILTYSESAERNCQNLSQIHERCTEWSRRHGCQFCPSKYELIHFIKPKRKRQHYHRTESERQDSWSATGLHAERLSPCPSARSENTTADHGTADGHWRHVGDVATFRTRDLSDGRATGNHIRSERMVSTTLGPGMDPRHRQSTKNGPSTMSATDRRRISSDSGRGARGRNLH